MKKLRKLSLFLMAALLCLSMAACGGNGSGSTDGDASSDEGGDIVKVGVLAPLTGDVAQYGTAVANGVKLYVDEYNAQGGLQIDLYDYDEEGDSAKALTGYNALMDKGVTAIIGDVTTAPTLAVVPESFADKMPMITASATAAAVTVNEDTGEVYTNMFRSCFIDPFQGEKMAGFAYEELEAKTAAVLFNTGSDYSVGLKDAFIQKAEELGLEVVAIEGYANKAVDFQGQLTNIAAKNPEVLFVPDYYETIALVAQQAQSAGLQAPMLGGDGWDAVLTVMPDTAPIEGSYYCSGYSPEDPGEAVQNFLAAYTAAYNETPNMFAAQGYDAAKILVAAIEVAEATDHERGSDEYRQAIIDAMKATDLECVTGHVTYDQFNNPEKDAVINVIEDGKAKFWGKY